MPACASKRDLLELMTLSYAKICLNTTPLQIYILETECPSMASSQCTYVVSIFYNRFMCHEGKSRKVEFLYSLTFFRSRESECTSLHMIARFFF